MMEPKPQNQERALNLIKAMEGEITVDMLHTYYHEDVIHIEYPNFFTSRLITRCYSDLQEKIQNDRRVLKDQEYDVRKTYSINNTVVVEAAWTAKLNTPLGYLNAGHHLKAYLTIFLEFRDGKIIRERNYNCFESL